MLLDKAKELGVDPFEILLRFAKDDWQGLGYTKAEQTIHTAGGGHYVERTISPDLRAKCASDACQFMLPKLKAIEVEDKSEFKPVVIYTSQWGSKEEGADDEGDANSGP